MSIAMIEEIMEFQIKARVFLAGNSE